MHLLTISAAPGVPEPPLAMFEPEPESEPEPEPDPELEVAPFVLLDVLGVVEVAGGGGAAGGGDPGGVPPFPFVGCRHGDGAESVVRAKKPIVTRTRTADSKERMIDKGCWS